METCNITNSGMVAWYSTRYNSNKEWMVWLINTVEENMWKLILIGMLCAIVGAAIGVILRHSPLLIYYLGWW